jgi:hypothetical protein
MIGEIHPHHISRYHITITARWARRLTKIADVDHTYSYSTCKDLWNPELHGSGGINDYHQVRGVIKPAEEQV